MKFYEGFEIEFRIDGELIPCLIDINLAQAQELLDSAYISGGWRGFRENMLTYSLDVSGIDIDGTLSGYKQLRTVKRAKTLVDWYLISTDNVLQLYGRALIVQLGKTDSEGEDISFTASLQGWGEIKTAPLVPPVVDDALQLEDSDFILLQDGDYTLLENA